MEEARRRQCSKLLSLVLRHRPEMIGIRLDASGWVRIEDLLAGCARHGRPLSREELEGIVRSCPKQRFAVDVLDRIRANQGHSVRIEIDLRPISPPDILFHGTSIARVASIRRQGLLKQKRHHVHLSADEATAHQVGERRGEAVILRVFAARMAAEGFVFLRSENGVWLTDHVPPTFIEFP